MRNYFIFICMWVYATCVWVLPEGLRGQIPWSWSYSGYRRPDMVLGTEFQSLRAAQIFNCWAISPHLTFVIF